MMSIRSGLFVKATSRQVDEKFGSDFDFSMNKFTSLYFHPTTPTTNINLRGDFQMLNGDAPFFVYPSINIRGIPIARYQGQKTAVAEIEGTWEVVNRWRLLAFVGSGKAFGNTGSIGIQDDVSFSDAETQTSKGLGFRYEIARKFQMSAGIDYAFGPEENAIYIQVGSAWGAF